MRRGGFLGGFIQQHKMQQKIQIRKGQANEFNNQKFLVAYEKEVTIKLLEQRLECRGLKEEWERTTKKQSIDSFKKPGWEGKREKSDFGEDRDEKGFILNFLTIADI